METQFIFYRLGVCATDRRGGDMHTKQQSGFTLVELAVVVFLIGILASLGLSAMNAQMANASISSTKKKQDTIKDALIGYLGKFKRLPCPDTNFAAPDGIENRGATGTPATPADPLQTCDKYFGIVPYQTLGLPKSAALDGWDDFLSYQVSDITLTGTPAPNLVWTMTAGFHTGNNGIITIKDRVGADTTNNVVVIISFGKNGFGAYTSKGTRNALPDSATLPDEYQNSTQLTTPTPPTFYSREFTDNSAATGGTYDDILTVLSPNDLISPLMKDGSLKSAESQWADQVSKINDALASYMLAPSLNCAPPSSGTQANFIALLQGNNIPTTDPWGGTLSYTQNLTLLKSNGSATLITSTTPLPYIVTTSTAGQVFYTPQVIPFYGKYQQIINNNCPP